MGEAKRKREAGLMPPKDTRFVYGARCTWFGTIKEIGKTRSGLPCCPHCRSPLFEFDTEEHWWESAKKYEDAGHHNYIDMLKWARGKHFMQLEDMRMAFFVAKGIDVDVSPLTGEAK